MLRESHIPLILWVSTAAMVHLGVGLPSHEAAEYTTGKSEIREFSRSVREGVAQKLTQDRKRLEATFEIDPDAPPLFVERNEEPEEPPNIVPDEAEPEAPMPVAEPPPEELPDPAVKPPDPKPEDEVEPEETPEPEAKPPPPEPPPEDPKLVAKKDDATKPKEPPQQIVLPPDGRIAIINDPNTAKDQEDNPDARRIADEANHIDEETMARLRSYDRNDSDPTGGGQPRIATGDEAGNADKDERGFSVENKDDGAPRAGAEDGSETPPPVQVARKQDAPLQQHQDGRQAQHGADAQAEGHGDHVPEAVSSDAGNWSLDPANEGDGRTKQRGRQARRAIAGRAAIGGVRFPKDPLPSHHSLPVGGVAQIFGDEYLDLEQEKARNTRLAQHRGVFMGGDFERFRAAIENYDPSVKPGNQTSLNAAKVPFASYINKMHNRIHPVFADGFLGSLAGLDPTDKLSNLKLSTHMELVLDAKTGKVVRLGITKPSGVTALEVAAMRSVEQAGPYGKAPDAIISPDGNVYLHWEFHRDPYYACTSKFARPYLLKNPPKVRPPSPLPPRPEVPRTAERAPAPKPLRPER